MRRNILIDKLIDDAKKLSGLSTEKEIIEQSLKLFIKIHKQNNLQQYFGALHWNGDLNSMRQD